MSTDIHPERAQRVEGRLAHPAREIRSLVARRREVLTTLGATFAALGIFLDNVLGGSLPPSLAAVRGRVFATYTFLLLVPAAILALRLARLNAGMVLNGILFTGKGALDSWRGTALGPAQRMLWVSRGSPRMVAPVVASSRGGSAFAILLKRSRRFLGLRWQCRGKIARSSLEYPSRDRFPSHRRLGETRSSISSHSWSILQSRQTSWRFGTG